MPDKEDNIDKVICYAPHHTVLNPKEPNILRIVLDSGAECFGQSLNRTLLQRLDLMSSLVDVPNCFGNEKVVIIADIRSMFYQVA